jgi:hypothetical protein
MSSAIAVIKYTLGGAKGLHPRAGQKKNTKNQKPNSVMRDSDW